MVLNDNDPKAKLLLVPTRRLNSLTQIHFMSVSNFVLSGNICFTSLFYLLTNNNCSEVTEMCR